MDLARALNDDASSPNADVGDIPIVCEPYEALSSALLREEVSRRRITTIRTGPDTNYNKAGFIKLLREHDRAAREATGTMVDSVGDSIDGSTVVHTVPSTVVHTVPSTAANTVGPVATTVASTVVATTVAGATSAMPAGTRTRTPTRIPHCAIRLLNVLFSDAFASRFAEMDAPDGTFWLDVRAAFLSDNPVYMNKISTHPALATITPKIYAAHSAEKLKSIWSEAVRAHQRASAEMAKGGPHSDSDFFKFCRGNANALYLNCWLERRPELRPDARVSSAPRVPVRAAFSTLRPRPMSASEAFDPIFRVAKRHKGNDAADDKLRATVRALVVDELVTMVRTIADMTGEHVRLKKEKVTQSQWLELAVGIDALRDRVKRQRPGTVEYADAERDLMYALNRKQKLQEELGN